MEGEARDRSNGNDRVRDALYRVALANGLGLTTDLVHLAPSLFRAGNGWRPTAESGALAAGAMRAIDCGIS